IEVAVCVLPHQVAGAEPGVAGLEHVAQDLPLGGLRAPVTLESAADVRWVLHDPAERLSGLVRAGSNAEAPVVADRLASLGVDPHQRDGESMREKRRNAPDGARRAVGVEERHAAFGRRVELENLWNTETALKLAPHILPKPVAAAHPQAMPGLVR